MLRSIFLTALFLVYQCGAFAQNKVILNAMKDELARSMEQLKLEKEAGPYYVSYLLQDAHTLRITADYGAITVNTDNRYRMLKLDLRVGSYAQDNSNFVSLANLAGLISTASAGSVRIPIDDDYDVIRTQLWQASDRAYKSALETLNKKKASLQNTVQTDSLPDFSKGETLSSLGTENSLVLQRDQWSGLVDQLSKLFLNQPGIQRSKVDLNVQVANIYYVNSEGTTGIEPFSVARLTVAAATQAQDGMPIQNFRTYTAARPENLPERAALGRDIQSLMSEILAARNAPVAEEYSGPVLFEAQASGELFSQGFGNLLVARKSPTADSPQTNAMLGRFLENPFVNKLNLKVASNFLSLKATPSLKTYNQKALLGSYGLDDEGIRPQDTSLIENGILKNLLSSRAPVKGISQSNGHARGGSPAASVIQVTSTNKKPYTQLKEDLIHAVKEEGLPFGYVVRGLTPTAEAFGGDADIIDSLLATQQGPPEPTQFKLTKPCSIFRLYPDGKEELVRGLEFGSISINAFKNILATSDDEFVYNYPVSALNVLGSLSGILNLLGASASGGLENSATVITPSMLMGGIDLKKSTGAYPKLPIVSYPSK